MPLLQVNQVNLYYELAGHDSSPVAFVHGSWSDHHTWDALIPYLSPSFRILAYDRRGHSLSQRPPGQGYLGDDVQDLGDLIQELELTPAHVVGNSLGAIIVLRLAILRPDLFRSMALHEPPLLELLPSDAEGRRLFSQATGGVSRAIEQLALGDTEGGARRFVEEVAIGPGGWDRLPPAIQETFTFNAPTWLDEMRDPDALKMDLDSLRRVGFPTLLTVGDQSYPWFARIVTTLARALPNCRVVTIPGAGHVPHASRPEQYAEVIKEFIARQG